MGWRLPAASFLAGWGDGRCVVSSPSFDVSWVADLNTPLGLELYRYGVTDPLVRFVVDRVRPGDTVVDGGANVGVITAALARRVGPDGTVVAVEAAPGTRQLLQRNVALNGFRNVTVIDAALTDHEGSVEFADEPEGSGTAGIQVFPRGAARSIRATTLDTELGDTPVRLVKLDIEGAEALALRGADRLLSNQRPQLVLEVEPDHLERFGTSLGQLRELLLDYGYDGQALALTDRGLAPIPLPPDWSRPVGATENYLVQPRYTLPRGRAA